jgi:transcriptional regulator with XRE-family HTH domain
MEKLQFINNDFHIGYLIKQKVKERGVNMNDFAKAIHCSRPNAYSIFRRKSVNIDLLQLVSEALNYDFVEIYNKSLDMNKLQKHCVVVLETNAKKLEELQTDTSVHVVHSWMVSEI